MIISLENRLMKRTSAGNLRTLTLTPDLLDFSSNDYLGLARSPLLAAAVLEEWQKSPNSLNGYGSTGSRLLTGNTRYAQELEERIASFHGYEAGILFNCGYMANLGLLSTIAQTEDLILFDAHIHASTHDGIRLSSAQKFPFRHNDLNHLEYRLKTCTHVRHLFICIESIYSTDGSTAPLNDICILAERYHAYLIVDEAHATGVLGPQGKGLVAQAHLQEHIFAHVVTFGKALGAQGAIVLGSSLLKNALINFATSYIYTTALPFYALAAIKCSYDLLPNLMLERKFIARLIQLCMSSELFASTTHIQAFPASGNSAASDLMHQLQGQGFDVRALKSPTVRRGAEVLRICLHAFNTEEQLQGLLNLLQDFSGRSHA